MLIGWLTELRRRLGVLAAIDARKPGRSGHGYVNARRRTGATGVVRRVRVVMWLFNSFQPVREAKWPSPNRSWPIGAGCTG